MPSNFVARGPEAYDSYMGRWNKRLASGFLEFAGLVEGGARLASRAPVRVFRRRVGEPIMLQFQRMQNQPSGAWQQNSILNLRITSLVSRGAIKEGPSR